MDEWERRTLTLRGNHDGNGFKDSPFHVNRTLQFINWILRVWAGNGLAFSGGDRGELEDGILTKPREGGKGKHQGMRQHPGWGQQQGGVLAPGTEGAGGGAAEGSKRELGVSHPAAGRCWVGWGGQPSHCGPRARQGGSRGEKQLNLAFLLSSDFLTLSPIGRTIPEAREPGSQLIQPTWVSCLSPRVEGKGSRGHAEDVRRRRHCPPSRVIPPTVLQNRYYYLPFIQEEAEAQRGIVVFPKSHS